MGETTSYFERLKSRFARTTTWAIRKSGWGGALIVAIALLVALSGVGVTMAATGAFSAPTRPPSVTPSPAQAPSNANVTDENFQLPEYYRGMAPVASAGGIGFRWLGSALEIAWMGKCTFGPIGVKVGPPNWGYLSKPVANIQALGGSSTSTMCGTKATLLAVGLSSSEVEYWKCFNFNEVWVEISGKTPDAGLHKVTFPASVVAKRCPPAASANDPTMSGSNPSSGPATPTPTPTAAPSPSPSAVPSPSPTPTQ